MRFPSLNHIDSINIFIQVVIVICIFYSANLGQDISGIETSYIIDTNTLNNRFITLGIKAAQQDKQGFQNIKNDLSQQMKQFNAKYEKGEQELKTKKSTKFLVDNISYALLFVQIILMIIKPKLSREAC